MTAIKRWLLAGAGLAALLTLGAFGYLWYALLSPYGYQPPAEQPGVASQLPQQVFAYGTLTHPLVRRIIVGRAVPATPASLEGYRRKGLDLLSAPGEQVEGRQFEVSGPELQRLDRYERLGSRYQRELHLLADGQSAWVYRRIEER